MGKLDPAVKRETIYISLSVLIFSVMMQFVFFIIGIWDYTVVLGNLLSGGVSVLNFLLMGIAVQSAVGLEEKQIRDKMKLSLTLRMFMIAAAMAVGFMLPCFSIWSTLIPLFFVRLAVAVRPLFGKLIDGNDGKK